MSDKVWIFNKTLSKLDNTAYLKTDTTKPIFYDNLIAKNEGWSKEHDIEILHDKGLYTENVPLIKIEPKNTIDKNKNRKIYESCKKKYEIVKNIDDSFHQKNYIERCLFETENNKLNDELALLEENLENMKATIDKLTIENESMKMKIIELEKNIALNNKSVDAVPVVETKL